MNNAIPLNELRFLYSKCKKIRPRLISLIQLVPEYIEALKRAQGNGVIFDDYEVFEIVQEEWMKLYNSNSGYRTAYKVITGISKDLYGDQNAWQYK